MGELEIHNVYNPEGMNADDVRRQIDIDSLRDTVCPPRNDEARLSMLVGDFNLHHTAWEPRLRNRLTPRATCFADTMSASKMQLITKPGVPTWTMPQKDRGKTFPSSTIDLMFANQALAPYVPKEVWRVIQVTAFESDHHLIGATIATRPNQFLARRFCWNLDDDTSCRLREGVQKSLAKLPIGTALPDEASTEEYAVRCSNAITNAASRCVPLLDPVTRRPRLQKAGSNRERGMHLPCLCHQPTEVAEGSSINSFRLSIKIAFTVSHAALRNGGSPDSCLTCPGSSKTKVGSPRQCHAGTKRAITSSKPSTVRRQAISAIPRHLNYQTNHCWGILTSLKEC